MALAKKDEQTPLVSGGSQEQKPIVEDDAKKDKPTVDPTVVKMIRETPMHKGGPVTANVHTDEVDAWTKAGWTVKE